MRYDVLIDRPWLDGARVRMDWPKQRLQFRDPHQKEGLKITIPWAKILHEEKTPLTRFGYTLAEDTSSLERNSDVDNLECYEVDEVPVSQEKAE